MRSQSVDEDAVEAQDMAAAVMNAAKKTLITQVMKKNVIENIVPTIIGLKHMVSIFIEYTVNSAMEATIGSINKYMYLVCSTMKDCCCDVFTM